MKKIPLTQGKYALVDDEDYSILSRYNWYYQKGHKKYTGYARTTVRQKFTVLMHDFIMNPTCRKQIDHKNGNGIDNRKENLRYCVQYLNLAGRKKMEGASSKYRGVHKCVDKRWNGITRWVVTYFKHGQKYNGGYFHNEIEAAKVADKLAKKLYGKFARLNFGK